MDLAPGIQVYGADRELVILFSDVEAEAHLDVCVHESGRILQSFCCRVENDGVAEGAVMLTFKMTSVLKLTCFVPLENKEFLMI